MVRLVFSGVDLASGTVQIYRIEPAGGVPTRLTAPSGAVWNECPSWSADGQLIYFDSLDRSTTNPAHIYRINATGGSRTPVDSPDAPTHLCPTVNRSGTQIAALEYANDGSEGIVLMNADGSGGHIVAGAAANQDNYSPGFAPNGSGILFNQVTFDENNIARSDLLIVSPAGHITNITRRRRPLLLPLVVASQEHDPRRTRGSGRRDRPDERQWQQRPSARQGAGRIAGRARRSRQTARRSRSRSASETAAIRASRAPARSGS